MRARFIGPLVAFLAVLPANVSLAPPAIAAFGDITLFPAPGYTPTHITAGPEGNAWFTSHNKIGRITPSGSIKEFTRGAVQQTYAITAGPDGNLWFTDRSANQIGRATPVTGSITLFSIPTANSGAGAISAGPDGNVWFSEDWAGKIARVTPSGQITEFTGAAANGMTPGQDGNVWFANGSQIGRINPQGDITFFPVPSNASGPGVALGPDGNVWFTEPAAHPDKIGKITPAGEVTEYPVTPDSQPSGITAGSDGNMWFVEAHNFFGKKVGKITMAGEVTEYPGTDNMTGPIASVLNGNLWLTTGSGPIARFELEPTPDLTVAPSKTKILYGQTVTLKGHLSAHGSEDSVSIYSSAYPFTQIKLIGSATVDANGNFSRSAKPSANTMFMARFVGDETYAANNTEWLLVYVQVVVKGRLLGFYGSQGKYRLYHYTQSCPRSRLGCPRFNASVIPNHARKFVYFRLQLFTRGSWRTVLYFRQRLNGTSGSTATFVYLSRSVIGIPTRARAEFKDDADHKGRNSLWSYFKVTH